MNTNMTAFTWLSKMLASLRSERKYSSLSIGGLDWLVPSGHTHFIAPSAPSIIEGHRWRSLNEYLLITLYDSNSSMYWLIVFRGYDLYVKGAYLFTLQAIRARGLISNFGVFIQTVIRSGYRLKKSPVKQPISTCTSQTPMSQ